ncbi:tRNA (adenosine(37)-N6)-threonylcarbamoyltransferase complex transferase subunit TsaD [Patescibacteria group bacterium]|nr:tRNA (adenosine(37)-N6)-threonylcarbamoyltransferase complex transferase subunit TsaD [Patescibacteria group bacterium]
MKKKPLILAVDTSCDDTSAAVVRGNTILSNIIASQTELHKPYGGVFPTVAKQAHKENIAPTIKTALKRASIALKNEINFKNKTNLTINNIDALAVTIGPGLAPALEVGLNHMKNLAIKTGKPLIAINHIEGHALSALAQRSARASKILKQPEQLIKANKNNIKYPVLSIVVSGGHTQFILFDKIGKYKIVGESIDDAAGECLDKIGRMLNLGYPAGSTMEKFARSGNPKTVTFPLPMTTTKSCNMSFSGLKTFARNYIEDTYGKTSPNKQQIYDFCASAQYGVFRHIMYKLSKVLDKYPVEEIWLGGGVAANIKLRQIIRKTIKEFEKNREEKNQRFVSKNLNKNNSKTVTQNSKIIFRTPFTNKLCMDNAAMIGLVAGYKFGHGEFVKNLDNLERIPRWKINT